MEVEISRGGFLDHTEVDDNLSVTSRHSFQELLDQGKIAIVDVDVQGAKALSTAGLDTFFIFIAPTSMFGYGCDQT
jgi:guanylate kinase